MFTPLVYNTSCLATTPNVSNLEGIALTSYDLFRCAVAILVTLALILGNSILALAVNSKYSAGILQFQVSILQIKKPARDAMAIDLFVLFTLADRQSSNQDSSHFTRHCLHPFPFSKPNQFIFPFNIRSVSDRQTCINFFSVATTIQRPFSRPHFQSNRKF